ncbi:hypothetical protein CfE428DRAFT_1414 [Chthoniobacter flavus Ellin428]|uniref:CBM-cenC domain-containing protein n=1 Tax=Chthoniobacter flavus Ellin428 TaxID=497964 RepID=B4CXX3_9BACT|nr:hypothetical protein [Chthoniobacter flavus]EDY21121.1 hypothetical protein CfE428DRAFT_1414 [Chthoniobacter flavus Ellin428]TCO83616.1 hypothetical protein EV701_14129 [Chthoniobacter flavus]
MKQLETLQKDMNNRKLAFALLTCCTLAAAYGQDSTTAKPNLLTNPSFADGQNGWEFHSAHDRGQATIDAIEKHGEKAAIRINNASGDDSILRQAIQVKPKTHYRLTGYIKTKDIVGKDGASLCLEGGFEHSPFITGTRSWTKVTLEFDSGAADTVKVGPRLGYYSGPAMGTAWFSDLSLVEAGPSRKR